MAKFMFVYRNHEETEKPSPEEMQQVMGVWMDWIQKGKEAGWLLDGGDGLKPEGKVVAPDKTVTDGPLVAAKELVAGYSIVQAEDLDAAVGYAQSSPMVELHHGSVEVRQLAEVG